MPISRPRPITVAFVFLTACSGAAPTAGLPRPAQATAPATTIALPALTAVEPDFSMPGEEPNWVTAPPDAGSLPAWAPPERKHVGPACKVVLQAQAEASRKDAKLPEDGTPMAISPVPCIAAADGAWGLVQTITGYSRNSLDAIRRFACDDPEGDACIYDANLSIVPTFVTAQGVAKKGKPLLVDTFFNSAPSDSSVGVFDYDGDGADELIFAFGRSAVLTVAGDKVVPYAAADKLSFRGIADVDRDGRPDLRLSNPYVVDPEGLGCGMRAGHPVMDFLVDVNMVARSLPDGTFSTSDAAAQAVAKATCPAAPKSIVVKDAKGHFDNDRIRRNVACARLWGVPAEDVTRALDASCKWPKAGDECDAMFDVGEGADVSVCAGRDQLTAWAKATPPITLK